jgi:hypothetical protein
MGEPTAKVVQVNAPVNAPAPAVSVPAPAVSVPAPAVSVPLPPAPLTKKRVFKIASAAAPESKEEAKEEQKEPVKVKAPRKLKVVSERRPELHSHKDELLDFYKKRGKAKTFKQYSYTPEGNLIITAEEPPRTIALRKFRALNPEEQQQISEERGQAIVAAEEAFDKARELLREAYVKYKDGGSAADVVRINKTVKEAEEARNKAMYPERYIVIGDNPEIRSVLTEQKYEARKLGHDVFIVKYSPFAKKDMFGHYAAAEEQAGGAEEGAEENEITILSTLIDSPEDKDLGYLHPCYMKDFTYGGLTYAFPLQAYEATRLKGLKQDTLVDELMKTRSSRTVKNIAARNSTPAQNAYELWSAILKAYYQQHQDLGKKLADTGDNLFRLAENSPSTSQYLKALFTVRASLRESQPSLEDVEAPVSTGGVITEEQQRMAKLAAILRAKKN